MANTIRTTDGIEVYESKIYVLCDEYINTLNDPEAIYNNPSLFTGMLKHIYKYLFKPGKNDKVLYNCNSILDTSNIELLDSIWNIYTELCYRYGKRPTLLNFSLLVGIGNDVFNSWMRGEYRAGENGTSSTYCQTAKKWKRECESSLVDGATEKNSIGCIFALKANYGYSETPQRVEIVNGQAPEQIAADIAARHSIGQIQPPELPDFTEE